MNHLFFERVLAYHSLMNQSYLYLVSEYYNPAYFEDKDIVIFMDVVVEFFKERNTVPTITEIKTRLQSPEDIQALVRVLNSFKELDKEVNETELLENTEKFLREKAVYHSILKVSETLSKNSVVEPDKILDIFSKACNISLVDDIGMDYFESIDEHCATLIKPNNTIPTGFNWLDKNLAGGWLKEGKSLYVFTGFTNVGKSIFLGHVALSALKMNYNVLLISFEMSEQMYATRITSNISQIGSTQFTEKIDEVKSRIISFKDTTKGKLIIKEFPTKGVTVNHINHYIQKLLKKDIKVDIVVVDYLNLIKSSSKNEGLYDQIKEIAEQLRASSYLFNIPIITASQLGRSAAKTEDPGMEKISESIGLSFTADAQMSIWATKESKESGLIYLGMQKNRFGPNFGHTVLNIDYTTLTLTEQPESSEVIESLDTSETPNAVDIDSILQEKFS